MKTLSRYFFERRPHHAFVVAALVNASRIEIVDALKVSVIAQTPVKSGWRVLMIADDPGRLVESDIVLNLNPPCALADTSWIKPGKTAWDWWNGSQEQGVKNPGENNGKNNDTVKYCIDFCAGNHFEYMIVDGGWSKVLPKLPGAVGYSFRGPMDLTQSVPAIDIPMLVDYGKSEKRPHLGLGAFPRRERPDGRCLRAIREMGRRRCQD